MPLHRRSQEIYGKNWWKPQNFVGNGPYVPVSFQPDDKLVIEKNPNYVGECGNVDRFEIKAGGLLSQMQNRKQQNRLKSRRQNVAERRCKTCS